MVNPLREPSSKAVQEALFNYLNHNRHKFDEYGQFDPTPDDRDFMPRVLLVADPYNPPKLTPEKPWLNKTQRYWAKNPVANQLRNPKTDEELVTERHEERMEHAKKRRKYGKDKCEKHYEDALKRCNAMYWNNALYPDGAYDGCKQRATELWQDCHNKGKYPKEKMEWANRDMGIEEESASEPRTIEFDKVQTPEMARSELYPDLNAWAKSQFLEASTPLAEGSQSELPPGFDRLLALTPALSRALRGIRATPGMGFAGSIGGGGGKLPLVPRNPFDPRAPVKLY